eukprot:TRINITY_DN778_c0_g6_i2.p1 TRINITY_DN778_c0_g6~~TRINITY_DN778_c0_g6_i2.p1  ORF type:complete len:242 (-),score=15.30 TRINITY_DN778_c0_g6_i2:199-924(-)
MYSKICLIYLSAVFLSDLTQAQNASCSDLHPNCIFVAAISLTGSTTVMDILNQHPEINLGGENNGLFSVFMNSLNSIKWQLDYEKVVTEQKWDDVRHFSTLSKERAYYGVGQMFKQYYGHGSNADKIVGFKEIRLRNQEQIEFVRGLCQNSKIILHFKEDLTGLHNLKFHKNDPRNSKEALKNAVKEYQEYNKKYPNDSFISTLESFKNPDYVENLFDFLGLSLDGVNISSTRVYNHKHHK